MEGAGGGDGASDVSYESVASEGGFEHASDRGRDMLPRIISSSHCVEVFRRMRRLDGAFCERSVKESAQREDGQAHDPLTQMPNRILRFDGAMEAWLEDGLAPKDTYSVPHQSLNDAAKLPSGRGRPDMSMLQAGNERVTIWYFSLEFLQQCWPFFLQQENAGLQLWVRALIERRCTIQSTHIDVGRIHCAEKGHKKRLVFLKKLHAAMQQSSWSPKGEARHLVARKKLTHVSMSIGDAVQIGRELYVAGLTEFIPVKEAEQLLPPRGEDEDDEDEDIDAEDPGEDDKEDAAEEAPKSSSSKKKKKKKNKGPKTEVNGEQSTEPAEKPTEKSLDKGKGKGKGKKKTNNTNDEGGKGDTEGNEGGQGGQGISKRKGKGRGRKGGKGEKGDDGDRQQEDKGQERADRRKLRAQLQAQRGEKGSS